jgi:hypothetical protein
MSPRLFLSLQSYCLNHPSDGITDVGHQPGKTITLKCILARRRWLTPVILATQEVEIRRIAVQGQPRQKVRETLFQPMTRHGGIHPSFQLLQEAHVQDHVQADPREKARSHLKNKAGQKGLVEAQVLEYLPSKHGALSSASSGGGGARYLV